MSFNEKAINLPIKIDTNYHLPVKRPNKPQKNLFKDILKKINDQNNTQNDPDIKEKRIKWLEEAWGKRCNLTPQQRKQKNIYGTNRLPLVIPHGYGFDRKTGTWYRLGPKDVLVPNGLGGYYKEYRHLPVTKEEEILLDAWIKGENPPKGMSFPWDEMGYPPDCKIPKKLRGLSCYIMRELKITINPITHKKSYHYCYYNDPEYEKKKNEYLAQHPNAVIQNGQTPWETA